MIVLTNDSRIIVTFMTAMSQWLSRYRSLVISIPKNGWMNLTTKTHFVIYGIHVHQGFRIMTQDHDPHHPTPNMYKWRIHVDPNYVLCQIIMAYDGYRHVAD